MRVLFRITKCLLEEAREDLARPHNFAAERVGFFSCKAASVKPRGLIILAHRYHPVADTDYLDDKTVGAMMGPEAIRKALQFALGDEVGMFHVHMHDHPGQPNPSRTDLNETAKFVPDFWHVRPRMPHGAIIVSTNSLSGRCWYPSRPRPVAISEITIVGSPLILIRN